jgi:hypothetical protein
MAESVTGMRDLILRLTDEDPSSDAHVGALVADRIGAELPEIVADPELHGPLRQSVDANLRLMAEIVSIGTDPAEAELPPAAVEYAREFVRRGMTIDALLRSCFTGHAAFFQNAGRRPRIESTIQRPWPGRSRSWQPGRSRSSKPSPAGSSSATAPSASAGRCPSPAQRWRSRV